MNFILVILAISCSYSVAANYIPGYGETHYQKILRMAYEVDTNPRLKEMWKKQYMANGLVLPDVRFDCNVELSPVEPTSVHRLRPSDIDVIGAFGDSITAGNGVGAESAFQVGVENRGEVYSIGGDETLDHGVVTLTNILRKFNPDIKGFSYCPSTRDNAKRSWLNVAVPGATNQDMPEQARFLIDRIKEDEVIDAWDDWKLLTMFIGGIDLCVSCNDWAKYSPEEYGRRVREAVDILYNELPRVYLNLVVTYDVTPLSNYTEFCGELQTQYCDCAMNETTVGEIRDTQLAYFNELQAIAMDEKYTYREDFAVVLQPHLRDFEPPIDPETGGYLEGFLAPDCFHPSRLGHQAFAFWLWNTMLLPVGTKPTESFLNMGPSPNYLSCPTVTSPYLFTNANSNP